MSVTQKLSPGLSKEDAWQDIEDLKSWDPAPLDMELLERARNFHQRYSLSWWDSLILSAAERTACTVVVSEDLSDGQTYFGIKVNNPFV